VTIQGRKLTHCWRFVSVAILVTLLGCKTSHKRVVVLDSWWDVDYTKSACWLASQNGGHIDDGCYEDGRPQIISFEQNLAAEFATAEVCNGVRLVTFSGPNHANEAYNEIIRKGGAYWWLMISLDNPARLIGHWDISYRDDHNPSNSKGFKADFDNNPRDIASRVCRIVKEKGADVASD